MCTAKTEIGPLLKRLKSPYNIMIAAICRTVWLFSGGLVHDVSFWYYALISLKAFTWGSLAVLVLPGRQRVLTC